MEIKKIKSIPMKNHKKYISKILYSELLKPQVIIPREQTIEKILKDGSSIARFGDGEFNMMKGGDIEFQPKNKELTKRLREVLNSEEENLLIGIPSYYFEDISIYVDKAREWFEYIQIRERLSTYKLLKNKNHKIYYNSNISRFYIDFKDKSHAKEYITKIKKLWENRNVIMVEGDKTRSGVGNDLYNNAKSFKRILAPAENAFVKYDEILNAIIKYANKGDLILMALGPTATVLAYDLYKNGYQAIDLGHLDLEYEWFLRGAEWKEKIENKYVNELNQRDVPESKDEKYIKQIICKIL